MPNCHELSFLDTTSSLILLQVSSVTEDVRGWVQGIHSSSKVMAHQPHSQLDLWLLVFSCKDAALHVLMSVCLSVVKLKFCLILIPSLPMSLSEVSLHAVLWACMQLPAVPYYIFLSEKLIRTSECLFSWVWDWEKKIWTKDWQYIEDLFYFIY